MLNSAEYEFCINNKSQITNNCNFFLDNMAEHENFSANKLKMPTIVGIFILFISRATFILS